MASITTIANVQPTLLEAIFDDIYYHNQVWRSSGILRVHALPRGGVSVDTPVWEKDPSEINVRDYVPNESMGDADLSEVSKKTVRIVRKKNTRIAVDETDEGESLPNLLTMLASTEARARAINTDTYIREAARMSCIQVAGTSGTETDNTKGDHNTQFTYKATPDKDARESFIEAVMAMVEKMQDRPLPNPALIMGVYWPRQVRRWGLFDVQRLGTGRFNDRQISQYQHLGLSEFFGVPVLIDPRMPTTGGVGAAYPIYAYNIGNSIEWVERDYGAKSAMPADKRNFEQSYLWTDGLAVYDANRIERIFPSVLPT